MNDIIQKTLLALKDVHGTLGSFVLDADGALLAMEMPKMFDVGTFAEVGPRIERLAESFSALGDELESCLVRFSDHLIYIKQFPKGGSLCVLTDSSVNLPALKMAMNLAHKRLGGEIATARPLSAKNGHAIAPEGSGVPIPAQAATMATADVATSPDATARGAGDDAGSLPAHAVADDASKTPARAPRYYRGHLVED